MLRHPSNRVRHLRTGNRKHISLRSPNDTGSVGRGRHVTGTRHSSICFSFVSRQKVWPVKGGSLAPSKWDTLFFYYFREIRMISIASQSDNSQNLETKECTVNNLLFFLLQNYGEENLEDHHTSPDFGTYSCSGHYRLHETYLIDN